MKKVNKYSLFVSLVMPSERYVRALTAVMFPSARDVSTSRRLAAKGGWGGGGYSRFQVSGMIEGFFGFEIFDSGIFFGGLI